MLGKARWMTVWYSSCISLQQGSIFVFRRFEEAESFPAIGQQREDPTACAADSTYDLNGSKFDNALAYALLTAVWCLRCHNMQTSFRLSDTQKPFS